MDIQQQCVSAYRRHRHLKIAGEELGIPWQTVYVHLKRAQEPVIGDKLKYGSEKDKLAAQAEIHFERLVPYAKSMNGERFQAKYDFIVRGYRVEVKAARAARSNSAHKGRRYAFSLKKQQHVADFFVCFCLEGNDFESCLLIPGEIARAKQTISVPINGGKWREYEIPEHELEPFFAALPKPAEEAPHD